MIVPKTTAYAVLVLLSLTILSSNFFAPGLDSIPRNDGADYSLAPSASAEGIVSQDGDGITFVDYTCPMIGTNRTDTPYCQLALNGSDATFKFKISGGIYNATLDAPSKTLTINFTDEFSKGFQLLLPRQLIDAKSGNTDSDFTIMLDGQNANYTELNTNSTHRELFVSTTRDDHTLQIVGTIATPEFQSTIILVLSMGTILTILKIISGRGNFHLIRN